MMWIAEKPVLKTQTAWHLNSKWVFVPCSLPFQLVPETLFAVKQRVSCNIRKKNHVDDLILRLCHNFPHKHV